MSKTMTWTESARDVLVVLSRNGHPSESRPAWCDAFRQSRPMPPTFERPSGPAHSLGRFEPGAVVLAPVDPANAHGPWASYTVEENSVYEIYNAALEGESMMGPAFVGFDDFNASRHGGGDA